MAMLLTDSASCFPKSILPFFLTNRSLVYLGRQYDQVNAHLPRLPVAREGFVTCPLGTMTCKQRLMEEVAGKASRASKKGEAAGVICLYLVLCRLPITQDAIMTLMWSRHLVIITKRAAYQDARAEV